MESSIPHSQRLDLAEDQPKLEGRFRRRRRGDLQGKIVSWILFVCALLSVLTTIAIVVSLVSQSIGFFVEVSFIEFITGTRWTPILKPQSFGVLPLVVDTLLIALLAAMVAIPVGLATAIYLSEYAPDKVRRAIKPILEILAGIPTVVYGYFALTFVTPQLQEIILDLKIFNALSAGIVMGIMIIPMVSSLSEDAMISVPTSLRNAAYALGATKLEVSLRVVVPAALSGIVAAFLLAISRAVGETMLVTIAAGQRPAIIPNPLESVQTMTAFIANTSLGEAAHGSVEYNSIFAVGILLFTITLIMNLLGFYIVRRWREKY